MSNNASLAWSSDGPLNCNCKIPIDIFRQVIVVTAAKTTEQLLTPASLPSVLLVGASNGETTSVLIPVRNSFFCLFIRPGFYFRKHKKFFFFKEFFSKSCQNIVNLKGPEFTKDITTLRNRFAWRNKVHRRSFWWYEKVPSIFGFSYHWSESETHSSKKRTKLTVGRNSVFHENTHCW